MDNRDEVREFLTPASQDHPARAGLPAGPRRRVPGLRRSEVAALADVSVEYYAKLERGHLAGVSPAVLEAVARVLQLDDAERAHLLHLAQAAEGSDTLARPRPRSGRQRTPHKSLQWTLDAITTGAAFVVNGRLDLLATDQLARAFFSDICGWAAGPSGFWAPGVIPATPAIGLPYPVALVTRTVLTPTSRPTGSPARKRPTGSATPSSMAHPVQRVGPARWRRAVRRVGHRCGWWCRPAGRTGRVRPASEGPPGRPGWRRRRRRW
ncbi:helix-turn-helix domain-containing protein [Streptomyces coeruleorubidus]|uniref:helix-turn-helix domain-containing protein n=1 Tax=Streptomyces coeruleorubidus TaxID=116188 RepID=UPI00237FC36A|nr:helix-turn-helix domain-containing protein [Streptomyces coeruleorubidus]WDV49403.1 helix-turn-helix domain-containing protein [Streptomyces coeruleorubidus]